MSANRLKHSESGFTLIEVTLAIVIGVVVIAGATVLYNQAKNSAANTAAQNKVNAASAVVEEFAAKNFGRYPTGAQFTSSWMRNRPDDYMSSPWGGQVGFVPGVRYGDTMHANMTAASASATAIGVIHYYNQAATTASYYDVQREATVSVRNYGLWIHDGQGNGPNFVVGGK
jgi:prepilin-type N-terminal cleavage/methylation domain-containing protein